MKKTGLIIILLILISSFTFGQLNESQYLEYLKNTYTTYNDYPLDFVMNQYKDYLDLYPQSAKNDEVYFLLGELYKKDRSYFKALLNYLKVLFLYPASDLSEKSTLSIAQIVKTEEESAFEKHRDKFLGGLNEINNNAQFEKSYFEYLIFIRSYDIDDLYEGIISDIHYYLEHFGIKNINAAVVLFWQAQLYEKMDEYSKAALTYKKFEYLFPNSDLLPEVNFNSGLIHFKELSKPNLAKESFVSLISNFAESKYAGDAQFYLAELYETELKDIPEAISNYRLLVETYPENEHAVEALKRVANILIDEDKYEEAIASYFQIVELYPKDKFAPEALLEIEYLYTRRLDNYVKAIETLKFFAKQYKEHEDAAEHLYDAAQMYYDDLDNKQAAIDTYHQVINEFPDSKYAKWAKDKIEDLSEE